MSKRPSPDRRLDWRDPEMPLVRGIPSREIDHHKLETVCQRSIQNNTEPTWRNDPTYNLRRKK